MQVISAVDNIRRRADAIARSHPVHPGEELDLPKLTEIIFSEANGRLLQDLQTAAQELQRRSSDLHSFQARGKLWRMLHAFQLKALKEKLTKANAEYHRICLRIEENREKFYANADSQREVLHQFEVLRKNKAVRNDALALFRDAEALIVQLQHNAKRYPTLSTILTSGLSVPDGATLSLAEASAFLTKLTNQMLSALEQPTPPDY